MMDTRSTRSGEAAVQSPIVRDAIRDLLDSIPFDEPSKPVHDAPEWPPNLADLSDEDLGEHMSYWAAMVAYASYHTAIQDADCKALELKRDRLYNETFVAVFEDNVTMAKAQADSDSSVVKASEEHLKADTRHRVLKAVLAGQEQRYAAVSREISRRMSQRERNV